MERIYIFRNCETNEKFWVPALSKVDAMGEAFYMAGEFQLLQICSLREAEFLYGIYLY